MRFGNSLSTTSPRRPSARRPGDPEAVLIGKRCSNDSSGANSEGSSIRGSYRIKFGGEYARRVRQERVEGINTAWLTCLGRNPRVVLTMNGGILVSLGKVSPITLKSLVITPGIFVFGRFRLKRGL